MKKENLCDNKSVRMYTCERGCRSQCCEKIVYTSDPVLCWLIKLFKGINLPFCYVVLTICDWFYIVFNLVLNICSWWGHTRLQTCLDTKVRKAIGTYRGKKWCIFVKHLVENGDGKSSMTFNVMDKLKYLKYRYTHT